MVDESYQHNWKINNWKLCNGVESTWKDLKVSLKFCIYAKKRMNSFLEYRTFNIANFFRTVIRVPRYAQYSRNVFGMKECLEEKEEPTVFHQINPQRQFC